MNYPFVLGNPRNPSTALFNVVVGMQVNSYQVNTWEVDVYATDKRHARELVKCYEQLTLFPMSIKQEIPAK